MQEVFNADEITIALLNNATADIRPVMGKGSADLTLDACAPLCKELARERKTLLLDRRPDDFAYLPIYAENDRWLDETAGRMIAPLMEGDSLVGTIGLGRSDTNDSFTFEDAALLDNIATHVAATLRSMRLAQDLSESREMQLVSQWSTMLLHDMKNYLAPLRIVAENLLAYRNEPEMIAVCARDISTVGARMEGLANALSELRCNPELGMESLCPNELVRDALATIQVANQKSVRLELALDSQSAVRGDRQMLRRVVENLITNAVDAMEGAGTLSIRTRDLRSNGTARVLIEVADTGGGIAPELLRDGLFRPFSTTKRKGLGLGLYQSRSIVRAHGGDLSVKSEPGRGSVFMVAMGGTPVGGGAATAALVEAPPDEPGSPESSDEEDA
jgi:signal transduction histidine kinase